MKGVILAGGKGTRLRPATTVMNKHLIPILGRPMILYPLETLKRIGVDDVLIVSGTEHMGTFIEFLGDGSQYGVSCTYKVQKEAGGIAQALGLAEDFMRGVSSFPVILGDNVFDPIENDIALVAPSILVKEVPDARRFGVATVEGERVTHIVEKPDIDGSGLAVLGFYMYTSDVFDIIRTLAPSDRGEIEITDVNMAYVQKGLLRAARFNGFWSDAGTPESLARTTAWALEKMQV